MMRTETHEGDSSRKQLVLEANEPERESTEEPGQPAVSGADGEQTAPVAPEPCSLYRFFDSDECLLYVGITSRGMNRFKQHAKTQSWWPDVVRSTVEHYACRQDARDAELAAIEWEQPLHNIADRRPEPTMPSGIREVHATEDFVERIEELRDELIDLVTDLDAVDGMTTASWTFWRQACEALEGLAAAEQDTL